MNKIRIHQSRSHRKASERYKDVTFYYEDGTVWEGSIPIEYRRTGTNLYEEKEIQEYLKKAYNYCQPSKRQKWLAEQEKFWASK